MTLGAKPYSLLDELQKFGNRSPPPLHLWDPPCLGDIDIRIDRTGNWYHDGDLITRQRLVKLFSTILRKEDDGDHYLVTPQEKWRIAVEDVAFVAILLDASEAGAQQELRFTTNVGDTVVADASHVLVLREPGPNATPLPYLVVRDGLEAVLSRNVYYQMAELLMPSEDGKWLGVWSGGVFFPLTQHE